MEFYEKIYLKIRPIILPVKTIKKIVKPRAKILDLGCGKGLIANEIKDFEIYTGVDIKVPINTKKKKIQYIEDDCNSFIKNDLKKFDKFIIIDLIHHIEKSKQKIFLDNLINSTKKDDILLIKDILPRNFIYGIWNKLHDLILSRQLVNYFDFKGFQDSLSTKNIRLINSFHKRIFLYDHYFLIIQKK